MHTSKSRLERDTTVYIISLSLIHLFMYQPPKDIDQDEVHFTFM